MKKLLKFIYRKKMRPNSEEEGQGIIEYAILLAFIALVVYAVVQLLEPSIGNVFSDFVANAPVAPPSLINYTPPPTTTPSPTHDPNASETPIPSATTVPDPATNTPTPSNTPIPTDTPTPTATAVCPITGAFNVPGRVQMEDFRCGGSGVAFVDNPLNGPGSNIYRPDVGANGPDLGVNSDAGGGYHLGWVEPGEWVEYEINSPTTEQYTLRIRYAAPNNIFPSLRVTVSQNPFDAGPYVLNPAPTGGWDTWGEAEVAITLFTGNNIIRFASNSAGTNGNFNYFEIVDFVATATPTAPTNTPTSVPTNTPTPTNTPLPTPTNTPLPGGGNALFIVANENNLNASDQAVQSRMQGLGYTVTLESANQATTADAAGMDIVLISSSVNSNQVANDGFDTLAVPLLTWEPFLYDDLKMTDDVPDTDFGFSVSNSNQIVITNPSHALAGGLTSGNVAISNSNTQRSWGAPSNSAITIANIPGNSSQKAIFAYNTGASMFDGLNAPARRVGIFLSNDTAADLTNNGWTLFDAAVNWAD